jgi:hypothetical protein
MTSAYRANNSRLCVIRVNQREISTGGAHSVCFLLLRILVQLENRFTSVVDVTSTLPACRNSSRIAKDTSLTDARFSKFHRKTMVGDGWSIQEMLFLPGCGKPRILVINARA